MTPPRRALVVSLSPLVTDPRVRRQVDWLTSDGWIVDSVGVGPHPTELVRNHYSIADQPHWTTTRYGRAAMHAFLPNRTKFGLLGSSRFPSNTAAAVRAENYDLVVFSDIELLPWIDDRRAFDRNGSTRFHLDLHEYFPPELPPGSRMRIRVESYYQWVRSYLADPRFVTRSVVAPGIGELYVDEFGFEQPALVRNAPHYADLQPGPVDPERIRLVYHGVADVRRGLREIIEAMRSTDDRFSLTLMILGAQSVIDALRADAADLGEKITFVPPVPMPDIAQEINQYDLEIMFFRPDTTNLLLALPNKFFEAMQGRLGLVIGDSPSMKQIVAAEGNGVVVSGWTGADLARTLNSLTTEQITAYKAATHRVAAVMSSEHERDVFLATLANE